MVLGFVGSVFLGGLTFFEYREFRLLKEAGMETEGVFFEDRSLNTGKGRVARNVIIDYDPEGSPPSRKQFTLTEAQYLKLREEKKIKITYLKTKPEVSEAGELGRYDFEKLAMALGLLVFSVVVLLFLRRLSSKVEAAIREN